MWKKWTQLLAVGLVAFAVACGGAATDETDDHGDTVAAAEEHQDGDEHAADAHDVDAHDASAVIATTHEDGDAHGTAAAATQDGGDSHDMNMAATDDDHDASDGEAYAYLEVAPKEALFLMQMSNFAYAPNDLTVKAGEVVEIAIQNVTTEPHDFTIERIDAELHVSYLEGSGEHAHAAGHPNADLHFVLTEPGAGVVHIKVHEPGEYVFYCTVPGHRELGMEGVLRVN